MSTESNQVYLNKYQVQHTLSQFPDMVFQIWMKTTKVDAVLFTETLSQVQKDYQSINRINKSQANVFCIFSIQACSTIEYQIFLTLSSETECKHMQDILKLYEIQTASIKASDSFYILNLINDQSQKKISNGQRENRI